MTLPAAVPRSLARARQLAAIAQNGLAYATDLFDLQRYMQLRGIAAEMIAERVGVERDCIVELLAREAGYATPKVEVRGVVFRDNEILLVRERSDGCWTVPGGWVDTGETPSQAVVKEVLEESGFLTRATKLLAVLDRDHQGHPPLVHAIYKLFLRCEIEGGEPVHSIETDAVGFFREDDLPPLSSERILPTQMTMLFDHLRDPDRPADFD